MVGGEARPRSAGEPSEEKEGSPALLGPRTTLAAALRASGPLPAGDRGRGRDEGGRGAGLGVPCSRRGREGATPRAPGPPLAGDKGGASGLPPAEDKGGAR